MILSSACTESRPSRFTVGTCIQGHHWRPMAPLGDRRTEIGDRRSEHRPDGRYPAAPGRFSVAWAWPVLRGVGLAEPGASTRRSGARNGEIGTSTRHSGARNGEIGTSTRHTGARNGELGTSTRHTGARNGELGGSTRHCARLGSAWWIDPGDPGVGAPRGGLGAPRGCGLLSPRVCLARCLIHDCDNELPEIREPGGLPPARFSHGSSCPDSWARAAALLRSHTEYVRGSGASRSSS